MKNRLLLGLAFGFGVLAGFLLFWMVEAFPGSAAPAEERTFSETPELPADTAVARVPPPARAEARAAERDTLTGGAPPADLPETPRLEQGPLVSSGGLAIPVQGIEPDDLTDTFTASRSQGRAHNAIDIMAPKNTPVVAAVTGRILRLFTSDKGGLTIYQLGPDDRTVYYYAHLDHYADGLEVGREVRQGDVIAYVGDTGNAAPGNYHLHFAIWTVDDPKHFWDGDPINPYPLLAD
jgi:murein DD-endopeptidase MepM/ murein hydrolase activator NlpD